MSLWFWQIEHRFFVVFLKRERETHLQQARGKFNNASALGRSLYWCQALHIMNKDRYQSTSARRALALLNSPLVLPIHLSQLRFTAKFYAQFMAWACRYVPVLTPFLLDISKQYYTIIDFNEVDIRIYLPEKVKIMSISCSTC